MNRSSRWRTRSTGWAFFLVLILVAACNRKGGDVEVNGNPQTPAEGGEKAPSMPSSTTIPEPLPRKGVPVLTEEEVKKLASLREKDPLLDAVKVNIFSFGYKYLDHKERLDALLASEGLDKRSFLHLMMKVCETLKARTMILEPFETMKKIFEELDGRGPGETAPPPSGKDKAKEGMKAKIEEMAGEVEKIGANLALLEKYGLLD